MVLNETRSVDLLDSIAATRRSENGVDSCAVDWKYSFATEGISGSERVTRAQVRFIYLCGARKVIVICAKFILASGTFDTVSYIAQSICVVLQISLRVPKIHEFYCQTPPLY